MKKITLLLLLTCSTIVGHSQAFIGQKTPQVKKFFKESGVPLHINGAILQGGDSLLSIESKICDIFCNIDANSHEVTAYIVIPNNMEFFKSYIQTLNESYYKLSERTWVNANYTILIEYTWLAEYADFGFIVKQR